MSDNKPVKKIASTAWRQNDVETYWVLYHPSLGLLMQDAEGDRTWDATKTADVFDAAHLDHAMVSGYLKRPNLLPGINDKNSIDLQVHKITLTAKMVPDNDSFAEAEIKEAKAKLSARERKLLGIED